ncbi:DUF935 family protein [Maridesulfovibrio sp.]|uniref:phage portal protein family protein n=1 Tax=Maridesulfovibrio sp. TaxID=2795000 RepID=UPI002AA941B8|nr:DUF935 family protein [Maridesulfovibrio sp.]
MSTGIWDSKGNWIEFSSGAMANLGTEFATSSRAMGFDPATIFGMLPDPDPVLRKRGEDAAILAELDGDDEVSTGIEKRTLRTQNKTNYTFNPGHAEGEEPTAQAVEICKQLERDLSALKLRDEFGEILETVFYGPTFSELMWEPHNGRFKLVGIVSKPRDWFGFNDERQPVFRSMESAEGDPLPPYKFLITRHRASFSNPYGKRLLTKCLWPVAFKRGGIEFWTKFCEKFGSAFMIAKAGKDAIERNVIAAQLVSMIQDAVAVLPPASDVELVQASGKAGDLHKAYVNHWNVTISKILTGQHLSTGQEGQGSRAASETHSAQLDALAESDQAMLVDSMNRLAQIYTRVNAGAEVFPPKFEYTEPEDYKEKAALDKELKDCGVVFKKVHFVRHYGLSEDEFFMDSSSPETAPDQGEDSAAFAAHAAESNFSAEPDEYQEAIDQLAKKLSSEATQLNEDFVSQIEKVVSQAENLEDMQIMLSELFGQSHDQNEIEELITNSMINTALAGRAAVYGENDD